jgi:class 3 adenylate cyclase/DNA-binding response OmpR family regulator/HAMP domain-containing protein
MALRVLLIQSDTQTAQPLARFFARRGDEVWQAWELGQARALLNQVHPDLVMMDLHFISSNWIEILRQVRADFPITKIIMTNKYPDMQREMLAREQNVHVFLRQPYTERWIEQAVRRVFHEQPPRESHLPAVITQPELVSASPKPIRVPMRMKITLPYLLLALLFAFASAYVVSRVTIESIQERYINQLIGTGKQSSDWMVREEGRLLETLRLAANTQGVAEAIQGQDAEALRSILLPLAVNAGEEMLELLDLDGTSLLSLRRQPEGGAAAYTMTRGDTDYRAWSFVQRVAAGTVDDEGDKHAGTVQAPWGSCFYVSGPVFDDAGNRVGILLVGKSLNSIVRQIHDETLSQVTIYGADGQPLASTLYTEQEIFPLAQSQVDDTLRSKYEAAATRDLTVSTLDYTEILGPWQVRGGEDLGVMGVSLVKAFLVSTSQVTRVEIYVLVVLSILLVLLVGIYLSNLITNPLQRLVLASNEVAQGNLEIKVDTKGDDEVSVLAHSFNFMIAGLQEGFIYRDLLGRTVSPEVREQLRQTFTSGNLRLEGQQAVATVLMCDIRGFTPISEQVDPSTVFQWLNDYFAQIVPIVAAYGGVVNKFDGDAILAFFGILPRMLSPKQSSSSACHAALEILRAIDRFNEERAARGEPALITGIGVNTGVVIAGGLGTTDRLHYTIIGDPVNTTQRIEALTREVMNCSGVLISQNTYSALGGAHSRFQFIPLGEHFVKGKAEPICVYRLMPPESDA